MLAEHKWLAWKQKYIFDKGKSQFSVYYLNLYLSYQTKYYTFIWNLQHRNFQSVLQEISKFFKKSFPLTCTAHLKQRDYRVLPVLLVLFVSVSGVIDHVWPDSDPAWVSPSGPPIIHSRTYEWHLRLPPDIHLHKCSHQQDCCHISSWSTPTHCTHELWVWQQFSPDFIHTASFK